MRRNRRARSVCDRIPLLLLLLVLLLPGSDETGVDDARCRRSDSDEGADNGEREESCRAMTERVGEWASAGFVQLFKISTEEARGEFLQFLFF